MAIRARCACQVIRSRASYTPSQGRFATPSTTAATQNIGFVGPTQLVGVDATPFTLQMVNGQASVLLPFYNLPTWTRGHPLVIPNIQRPWRNQLRTRQTYVQPMNQLFFETNHMNVQGPPGVTVSTTPHVVDAQGITATGPFIGGGRSFNQWQVQVTATAAKHVNGTITGQAVGRLHHVFS